MLVGLTLRRGPPDGFWARVIGPTLWPTQDANPRLKSGRRGCCASSTLARRGQAADRQGEPFRASPGERDRETTWDFALAADGLAAAIPIGELGSERSPAFIPLTLSAEAPALADRTPLPPLIEAHVLAATRLHGDDTTVPLLARGGTKTARLWTYVRDDRPFAGTAPPAVVFKFSRDRGGEHPSEHLTGWQGILQADAYAGYNQLYDRKRSPGPVTSALCWSHSRRKFFELADVEANIRKGKSPKEISPIAFEAVKRIDALFEVERNLNGLAAAGRLDARQRLSAPLVENLESWLRGERALLSKHAKVAKAIDYLLSPDHWRASPASWRMAVFA